MTNKKIKLNRQAACVYFATFSLLTEVCYFDRIITLLHPELAKFIDITLRVLSNLIIERTKVSKQEYFYGELEMISHKVPWSTNSQIK